MGRGLFLDSALGAHRAVYALGLVLGLTAVAGALSVPSSAEAQATPAPGSLMREPGFSMTFRSVYHAYQVRLFTDPVVTTSSLTAAVTRTTIDKFRNVNPLYMSVDAGGWNLGPGGDFDAVVSMRYNTDFGTGFHRDTPNDAGIPAVDGRHDVDLILLYVDWKNVVEDTLDLRFGRQVLLDDLDWYSLDGVKASAHVVRSSTASIDIEAYAGMPVRIGRVFASEAFINDGFEISDGPGLTFGGAVFGRFFGDLTLSAAYRQELVFRKDDITVFAPPGFANAGAVQDASGGKYSLQESLFGGSAGYAIRPIDVDVYANLILNLVFGKIDFIRAGASFNPDRSLSVNAEVMHVYPRFAADSIFNVFNIFPYTRGQMNAEFEIVTGLSAEVGYFLLSVTGSPSTSGVGYSFLGEEIAHGPSLGLTYKTGSLMAGIRGEASTNFGGSYAFGGNYRRAEVFGDASFLEERFGAVLRVGLTTVQNDWFERLDDGEVATAETSYTVDVGGRAKIAEGVNVRLNFIKNFESLFEGSYRILGVFELRY